MKGDTMRPQSLSVSCLLLFCAWAAQAQTPKIPEAWQPHDVRLLNGDKPVQVPAQFQIVTERWNRVVAVPYIVYMPEKDRLLMLVGCDYPHHAMVLTSDDHGANWTEPRPIALDNDGKTIPGLGTSLTYLGSGKLLLATDRLWFSSDYGATWGGPEPQAEPLPVPPTLGGKTWNLWDPLLVEKKDGGPIRLVETGYAMDADWYNAAKGPGYSTGQIRFSTDEGRTWTGEAAVPQWKGVSEVALLRAANGNLVAACRTDIPAHFKGETLDHFEGLAVSLSKDDGLTWSDPKPLYDWGRHHPCMVLLRNGDIVMTYVVRKGYTEDADGFARFGIEAIVSHDHGQTWDLDHRYILHAWTGNRKGPEYWWASSQSTSTVLLPDDSLLTAFGTGYRSQPGPKGPGPRDVGLIRWHLSDAPLNADRAITGAPPDSELRNVAEGRLNSDSDGYTIAGLPQHAVKWQNPYLNAKMTKVILHSTFGDTVGVVFEPGGPVDSQHRWAWVANYCSTLPWSDTGWSVFQQYYVQHLLDRGFYVVGVDVGTSCGSPASADVFEQFYGMLMKNYTLNAKTRLIGQSNGGLIVYGWAFRHPEKVDRILGILPATDFTSWPGLDHVCSYPPAGLAYDCPAVTGNPGRFNPIENLAPLADAGVKLYHIHGDADTVVPIQPNTQALQGRYQALGGAITVELVPGGTHGAPAAAFFESQGALQFLLGD